LARFSWKPITYGDLPRLGAQSNRAYTDLHRLCGISSRDGEWTLPASLAVANPKRRPERRPDSGDDGASYTWAKNHGSTGRKRATLEELRTVLGLDSVKDADGSVIREAPLAAWANFRDPALYTAIREINEKTDLNISLAWTQGPMKAQLPLLENGW
jgi:hypothetical protein